MQIHLTITFTERELRGLYAALASRTSQVLSEEGDESPRLTPLREARAKVAEKLHQCHEIADLAAA